jgi:hypothetical protein
MLLLLNGLVVGGLSGTLNGFGLEEEEIPKRFVVVFEVDSAVTSLSLSLSVSDGLDELLPKLLNAGLGKNDAGAAPNELDPKGDVGFAPVSVEAFGGERKSGTVAVEPKADFGGLEEAAGGAVLEVGNDNPDEDEATSNLGVDGVAVLLDGVDILPNPVKPDEAVTGGFDV